MSARSLRLLVLVAAAAGCEGGGSDVGPSFQGTASPRLMGMVLDREGRPINSVRFTFQDRVGTSDGSGRFWIFRVDPGQDTLQVGGEIGSIPGAGEAYASMAFPVVYSGGRAAIVRPVILPDRASGAEQVLPLGIPLPAGTILQDLRTASRLILDGVTLSLADPSSGTTEVTVGFSILDAQDLPLPVVDGSGSLLQNGTVALIEPFELLLDGARLVLADELSFPPGTPELRSYGLPAEDGTWMDLGAATATGGAVELGAVVESAGMFTYARECQVGSMTTTVSGTIIDRDGQPVRNVLVAVGIGSTVSDNDGAYTVAGLCAVDGQGAPLELVVRVQAPPERRALAAATRVAAVPGGTTVVPPVTFDTPEVVDVRVQVIFEGFQQADRQISVGNLAFGSTRALTDENGEFLFTDVDTDERTALSSSFFQQDNENKIFQAVRHFEPQGGGTTSSHKLYIDDVRFRARKLDGSAAVRVVVRGSSGPLRKALAMTGFEPDRSGRRKLTGDNGVSHLSGTGKAPGFITAGIQTETACTDGAHETLQRISYKSASGIDTRHLALDLLTAVDPTGHAGIAPYGVVDGEIVGASDPMSVPPMRTAYRIEAMVHREARREELQACWLGLAEDPPVIRLDLPVRDPIASFADPFYSLAVDPGTPRVVAVERDVDASGSGPIISAGISEGVEVEAATVALAEVMLAGNSAAPISLFMVGLDGSLAGSSPRTQFGWTADDDQGYFGGELRDAAFDPGATRLDVTLPSAPTSLAGGPELLFLEWSGSSSADSFDQRAVVLDPTNGANVELLAVPRVTTPAPSEPFDPTGAGIVFVNDPRAQLTIVRVSREESTNDGTGTKLVEYEWVVDVAPGISNVVFPVLPEMVSNEEIPQFFSSGTYQIEIRAVYGERLDFNLRETFRDTLLEWQSDPRLTSSYTTTAIIP